MVELRPYQITALKKLHQAVQQKDRLLLQAATGSGKTVVIVRMIQKYFLDHPGRSFLILMHKKELVQQFMDSFHNFTDIPDTDIGIACSGIKKKADLDRRITVASVQTLINKMDRYPGADLMVVDETHRVGPEAESQYQQLLVKLEEYRPWRKVIGVTATAYRLGHGYIYGDQCRPGNHNYFPELTHRITYRELVDGGYLMPLSGRIAGNESLTEDLKNVSKNGDYVLTQLGEVMGKDIHVRSAVDAYERYGSHHQHVCVFGCTIDHTEKLTEAFQDRGHSAVVIHSQLDRKTRNANIKAWQTGRVKVAVSINILTEGFDFPELSCLLFCRPTLSPTLFVQAIGRVVRIAEGKNEALLIDLTNNTKTFGTNLDNPQFNIPKAGAGEGEAPTAPTKVCPGFDNDGFFCGMPVHAGLKYCPRCGYEFPTDGWVEAKLGDLKQVSFTGREEPISYEVKRVSYEEHLSQRSGKALMKVSYWCGDILNPQKRFMDFICLPDQYHGYAVQKARRWWEERSDEPFPDTVEEALFLADSLNQPTFISVDQNGKYPRIVNHEFDSPGHDGDEVPF